MKLRLIHKGIILVSVPLLFELIFVGALGTLYAQAEAEAKRAEHSKAISDGITQLAKDLVEILRGVDGRSLTEPGFDTEALRADLKHVNQEVEDIKNLVSDNKHQLEVVSQAQQGLYKEEAICEQIAHAYDTTGPASVEQVLRVLRKPMQKEMIKIASSDLLTLAQEEKEIVDKSPEAQEQYRNRVKSVLALGVGFNIILTMLLAVGFSKGIARRIYVLTDNSIRLAQGKPLQPPIPGSDEIAHLDRVFHNMAAALAEAERSKQEVIGMVTHDLKTPLATVVALLDMLEAGMFGKLNDEGMNNLQTVSKNVARMNMLIRDLLDIEKIKSGMLDLYKTQFQVSSVLNESVAVVESLTRDSKIRFVVEAPDLQVFADYPRVIQVLVNLLSNALKFSPDGSVVKLTAEDDGKFVKLCVTDQGRGIPEHLQQAIFERFKQTSAADATVKGGTGLGLAICKALVEMHGGTIGVTSQEGQGSTFYFILPKQEMPAIPKKVDDPVPMA